MFRGPAGIASLLKEGTRHFQGNDEAVFRNIESAKVLQDILKPCFGPTGMSKLVNNFLDKRFLTSDGSCVVSELEIQHPCAKVIVTGSQMQNIEFGDGTNYVILLASELLFRAGSLLQQGLHVSTITEGYERSLNKALQLLEQQVIYTLGNSAGGTNALGLPVSAEEWVEIMRPIVYTKVKSDREKLVRLFVDACLGALCGSDPKSFNTDNVRVSKIPGGSLGDSFLVNGMVLTREPKTSCLEKYNCKVCVLANALEIAGTEGTATVLVKTADQLKQFTKGEEEEMEALVKSYKDAGVDALIVGGHISSLAHHYLEKYNMWALTTPSKFDIKRFCRTLRVPAKQRITPPMEEEIGLAEYVGVQEVGGQTVSVVRGKDTRIQTIVLRGPSRAMLDEVERAIDDVVSLFKAVTKDARFVAGGGAAEVRVSKDLLIYKDSMTDLHQFAVEEFAQSLLVVPKTLAENAGQDSLLALAQLKAVSGKTMGIDVTGFDPEQLVRDMCAKRAGKADESLDHVPFPYLGTPVYDHFMTKKWAMRLAVDAAITVLRVDSIIMAKPAGGPKMPDRGHWDAADDREPFAE